MGEGETIFFFVGFDVRNSQPPPASRGDGLRQALAGNHDVLWHGSVSEQLNFDHHAGIAPELVAKQYLVQVITLRCIAE
jgi:hypothetical protein